MVSPDEAFSALGNETRIRILQTLADTDGPLSFTELRTRLNYRHGGQFNYHLDQLVDHFVRKTDDGYDLRPAGRRIIQAVQSGAVTEAPVIERRPSDEPCQLCGAPIEIQYVEERVEAFCTACRGVWGQNEDGEDGGHLGGRYLPPAGVKGRSQVSMYRAAWTWTQLKLFAIGSGLCPACSAQLENEPVVCEKHEPGTDVCEGCGRRYAVRVLSRCTNCLFEGAGTLPVCVITNTDFLAQLTRHDLNPIVPDSIAAVQRVFSDFEEEVLSTEPFEVRMTFTVDGDSISLTVGEDLEVVDVTRLGTSPTD